MVRLKWMMVVAGVVAVTACKTAQTPPPAAPGDMGSPGVSTVPVTPSEPVNMLENSEFSGGVSAPWMPVIIPPAEAAAEIRDGAFCVDIKNRGMNNWDIQMTYRGLHIEKGHHYEVNAKVWADKDTSVRAKVGMSGPPYREYWNQGMAVGPEPKIMTASFSMNDASDSTAEFAFHIGGSLARLNNLPLTVCIDEVTLSDPQFVPTPKEPEPEIADVLVNQVGYLPGLPKTATVRLNGIGSVKWTLLKDGKKVVEGSTKGFGKDAASGDHVHIIDFSEWNVEGEGYVLAVGALKSHPFAISKKIYSKMKVDAQRYFYHHRANVPIEMPYAGAAEWAHPAGHLQDKSVPCLPEIGCSYSLDVSGGWYDAGDHGKYVINAGYAVWALLNAYERAVHVSKNSDAFADKTLNIPESGNGVSDLLDEVRFELEFMLAMEVPEGEPLAGMVHHKMHDEEWTAVPTAPFKDTVRRFLHAPSTAATLNLSAVAAQAARIWKDIDPVFSTKCAEAAKRTYAAALKHPDLLIGPDDNKGGGAYEDSRVDDEFFWAAAELYITTGEGKYLKALKKSPYFAKVPTNDDVRKTGWNERSAASWQYVSMLGNWSLLTAPSSLGAKDKTKIQNRLVAAADLGVKVISEEGYRIAFTSKPKPDYYWGTTYNAMNNLMLLAIAYDLTKNTAYRDALVEGTDYLLGRNSLDQSFVSGYGTRPLRHPHHRYFADQPPLYPPVPPGFIAGGPNQNFQDPRIQASVPKDAAPARCYVDHIDSYSTNEVAINWNGAFVWLTAVLDELASSTPEK